MLCAIVTGNIATGRLSMSLGTSGTVYAFTETPIIDTKGEISAFCESTDHWLALACTMNVASAVDRVRDLFIWEMNALEKNVVRSEPGAYGLTFLPHLEGVQMATLLQCAAWTAS